MNTGLADKTLLVVGPGLIGGSLARAVRELGVCKRLLGCGQNAQELEAGLQAGVFDQVSLKVEDLAPQADVIVIAVPTLALAQVLGSLRPCLKPDAVITDTASVKGTVVADARRLLGEALPRFVPGHPIAGSERSGFSAARSDLFRGRKVIITPAADCEANAVHLVARLWHLIGADVHGMSVLRHDEVLAATSHLPHLLAFTLVNTLVRRERQAPAATGYDACQERLQQVFDYAAGGFADFTRIAGSDPVMWRDIFLANADASVKVLDDYLADLQGMRECLLQGDGDGMLQAFADARATRNRFIDRFEAARVRRNGGRGEAAELAQLDEQMMAPAAQPLMHLTLWLAAMADGVSEIKGFVDTGATLATLQLLRDLGVPVVGPECGQLRIYGVGSRGFFPPPVVALTDLDSAALAMVVLSVQSFSSELRAPLAPAVQRILQASGVRLQADAGRVRLQGGDSLSPPAANDADDAIANLTKVLASMFMTGQQTLSLPPAALDVSCHSLLAAFGVSLQPGSGTAWGQIQCGQRPQAAAVDLAGLVAGKPLDERIQ